jgi:hypothetical protein
MGRGNLLSLVITISLFLSCGTQFKSISFNEIHIDRTPTIEDYPDANAVYLLREAKFEIKTMSTFSEHVIIKVLKEGGKIYANIKIPFWQDCEVLDLKARTIKPNGEIVTLDKKDVFEVSDFPEYIMYADRKAIYFPCRRCRMCARIHIYIRIQITLRSDVVFPRV